MKKGLVSVIVPIYNVEQYLPACVHSILGQTYTNLEIILVDDDSPDRCGKLCDDFAGKDARIRVIHQKNMGPGGARNTGIDAAQGEFLAFADPDDELCPDEIERLMDALVKNKADASVCGFRYISEDGRKQESVSLVSSPETISGRDLQFRYFDSYEASIYCMVVWNKLYRAELFDRMRYPVGKLHEDEDLTLRLLYPAKRIALTAYPGYLYRIKLKTSIMGEFSERRFELFDAYISRMRFYAAHGEEELWRKTLLHALHMFEQDLALARKSGMDASVPERYRRKIAAAAVEQRPWIRGRLKAELALSVRTPALYHRLWRLKNR